MEKRRSEVDRRLDSLINQSSRALRQVNRTTVLKLLRLFNLCDLGTNSADKDKAKQAHGSPRRGPARPRAVQNAVDHSEVITALPPFHVMLALCACLYCDAAEHSKHQIAYPHNKAWLLYLNLLYPARPDTSLPFSTLSCPAVPCPVLTPDAEHPSARCCMNNLPECLPHILCLFLAHKCLTAVVYHAQSQLSVFTGQREHIFLYLHAQATCSHCADTILLTA